MKRKIQFRIPFKNPETGKNIQVTVFEPQQENEANPSLILLSSAKKCWSAISNDAEAKRAVKLLAKGGGDWVVVLSVVEHYCRYCRPNEKAGHIKFRNNMSKLRKQISKFASGVTKWNTQIRNMNLKIERVLPVDATAHTPDLASDDQALYRKRNEIERLFRRLKGFRRIFSRFDKLDVVFLAFLNFALIVEALR
jgi:hypothetical protein